MLNHRKYPSRNLKTLKMRIGGFSDDELKAIEERAYTLGAKEHVTLDVTEEYT